MRQSPVKSKDVPLLLLPPPQETRKIVKVRIVMTVNSFFIPPPESKQEVSAVHRKALTVINRLAV
jgi:hypothetical protein